MATLVKTAQGRWKSVIRRRGWPTVAKTFRTKSDAQDWGSATEDEMLQIAPGVPDRRMESCGSMVVIASSFPRVNRQSS